ncbi:MAG: hypothetical protein ACYSUQ_05360 [Planctomycetota bacterium]|jgi:hypothetical protein
MSKRSAVLLILGLGLFLASDAIAQERSGFWLRFNVGAGYANLSSDVSGIGDFELTGGAGVGSVAAGLFLNDRLVLFGEFAADILSDPTVKVNGEDIGATESFTATAGGFGAGIQYYLARTWFLSGSVYVTDVSFEQGNTTVSTDPGFGFRILLGKDWPVSRTIALGVAGDGLVVLGATDDDGDAWNSFGLGLTFSFTWSPKGIR